MYIKCFDIKTFVFFVHDEKQNAYITMQLKY